MKILSTAIIVLGLLASQLCWAEITLDAFLSQVERNHPKLGSAEFERRMAAAKRLEKQGAFDPSLRLESDTQRYNSYPRRGEEKFETLNDVSIDMVTRYGAKIGTNSNFHFGDIKSPASGTGDSGTHFFGINLPLLRGARINEKFAAEQKALIGEPLADADFRQFRLGLLLSATSYYWDWVATRLQMEINQDLIELAEIRAQQVEARAQAGDLPLIDSVEASQEVRRRQEIGLKSQREFQKAAISLSYYLWTDEGVGGVTPTLDETPDSIPIPQPFLPERLDEGKMIALKNRPELAQIDLLKDINNVDMSLAKNQRLPILDLYAGPGVDTGANSIGPTYKLGASLIVPLRNRTARGQIEQAALKLEKLNLDEKALVQQILLEVVDTASELNLTYQRYEAANEAYQLAKQLEEGELIRFEAGDSTLFLVNQRERARAESSMKVVEIQAEYQKALIRLLAVMGTL